MNRILYSYYAKLEELKYALDGQTNFHPSHTFHQRTLYLHQLEISLQQQIRFLEIENQRLRSQPRKIVYESMPMGKWVPVSESYDFLSNDEIDGLNNQLRQIEAKHQSL